MTALAAKPFYQTRPYLILAMQTLVIPPAAQRDENSVQMLSAWIAEQGLHCTLNVGMWASAGHSEPNVWGILLADVTRPIGNALAQEQGLPPAETVQTILNAMQEELDEPTSNATGQFHPGHA